MRQPHGNFDSAAESIACFLVVQGADLGAAAN